MFGSRKFRIGSFWLVVAALTFFAVVPGRAIDVILFEELKEMAVQYGKISQRFVTCKIEPPYSVKTAFLKYARHQGASPQYLEILGKVFDDGAARVRNLRSGFSPEECEAKLESPEGQELLEAIRKWGAS